MRHRRVRHVKRICEIAHLVAGGPANRSDDDWLQEVRAQVQAERMATAEKFRRAQLEYDARQRARRQIVDARAAKQVYGLRAYVAQRASRKRTEASTETQHDEAMEQEMLNLLAERGSDVE